MEIQVSRAWRDFEKKGAGRGYGAFSASEIPSVSYYQFQCGKKYRYRCDLTPAAYPGKRITGGEGGRGGKNQQRAAVLASSRAIVPAAPTFNAILL